jgi:D-glycero-D-manno-heptose 1,7-bisphosphate phosphatase
MLNFSLNNVIAAKLLNRRFYFFRFNIKLLSRKKTLKICFVDLDGTLWPDKMIGNTLIKQFPTKSKEQILKFLKKDFDFVIAVSNQTLFARMDKVRIGVLMKYLWTLYGIRNRFFIDGYLLCHHHPNSSNLLLRTNCNCRKPLSGLLLSFQSRYGISFMSSVFIGDRISDVVCANTVGITNVYLIQHSDSFNKIESHITWPKSFYFRVIKDLEEVYADRDNET